ncbi:nucleotide exchange factor GrpE [Nocardia sp. NPDC127579]|uniref:nucleotide exchange factor GrpE n=1 Tax=Nocardia sp. NPDC127579 TaxID=3345402 RepID=UPI003626EA2C
MTQHDETAVDGLVREIGYLRDLFVRRLREDTDKRALIDDLFARTKQAELGPFRQYLQPLVSDLALLIGRLDDYAGSDAGFIDSVRDELLEALARYGVREVPTDGVFDPSLHEAVAVQESEAPQHSVLAVRRRGFSHDGWVFRPASVVISTQDAGQ